MAQFKIDRIRYNWKGIWSISTPYVKDDIVKFGGNTYVAMETHVSSAISFYQDIGYVNDFGDVDPRWVLMTDGVSWAGEWVPQLEYRANDIVKYRGILYQCIAPHVSAETTEEGLEADIEKWKIVARGSNWLSSWSPDTEYKINDIIKYNGVLYTCIDYHVSSTVVNGLEFDQEKWQVLFDTDAWLGDWTVDTRYKVNDVIKYGGNVYRCIEGHTSLDNDEEGLEDDLGSGQVTQKWELVVEGIRYRQEWTSDIKYRMNDVVQIGPSLYKARYGHVSPTTFDDDPWEIYLPGLDFEDVWNEFSTYQPGDIVKYGGYSYVCIDFNQNFQPVNNPNQWTLLTTGYNLTGEFDSSADYRTGDVVRVNGYLYLATDTVSSIQNAPPGTLNGQPYWELLVTGIFYRAEWKEMLDDSTPYEYFPGDVVADESTTFICIQQHFANVFEGRPKLDTRETTGANNYWKVYISGDDANVLRYKGDLKVYDVTDDGSTVGETRLPVGEAGQVLKVQDDYTLSWESLDQTEKVYWVSLDGVDEIDKGTSPASPFRTIKYASEYILADEINRAPATIIVRTGVYQEQLPIIVPANCAITGDELRSTVITPAPGYETQNMFYVRNATGIRNCTLQGLTGTLDIPNDNNTQRPTAGAYVSLDPGTGVDDEDVWISSKSPYIQNVTTFGTGCIGMKVDGDLHEGGNKSIVANDFTQILSDGIGYWVNGEGKSELVSVFTYYCHIGYLATNGGKVRATNGNNSYGKYGCVAEGFDLTETPKTALIDNRAQQAQLNSLYSNGSGIFGVSYEHCGQDYTNATLTVTGTSTNFEAEYSEFRNAGVSEVYITEEDSFQIGGNNYTTINGTAQAGNETQITLSGADEGTNELYNGQRIFIQEGKGFGQYAKIASYNPLNRILQVEKESNGEPGWDHISGRPIATLLDDTTKYLIEPRVVIDPPPFSMNITNLNSSIDIASSLSDIVAIPGTGNQVYTSQNGNNWNNDTLSVNSDWGTIAYGNGEYVILPANGTDMVYGNIGSWNTATIAEYSYKSAAFGNGNWFAVGEQINGDSTNTVQKSIGSASNWIDFTMPFVANWSSIAYGNDTWVAIAEFADDSTAAGISTFAVSTDDGATFQSVDTGVTARWKHIIFAYDKFIAIESSADSTPCAVAISYDGLTWSTTEIPTGQYTRIAYQQGLYVMADPGTDRILLSEDGYSWREKLHTGIGAWTSVAALNNSTWVVSGTDNSLIIETGATAKARANVGGGRIGKILIHDPGSNYIGEPAVTVYDNQNTSDITYRVYVNNNVLPQPKIINPGTGYLRASGSISGDGFAEQFQIGSTLKIKNSTNIPGPGANIRINGIDDVIYFVTKVDSVTGSEGDYTLTLQINPALGKNESPTHETGLTIRELYSQIRLTGHDFLDIGTGNFEDTSYPGLYVFGYESVNEPQPFNETVLYNGGRVFYTSTDQDGNFRVGELFEVEQATGTISINAAFFDLGGLDELRLGGVVLGGTGAVVREFSTDPTFAANSNNIVPTQKAIAGYIDSRLASGGSDPRVNRLNAGEISITGNNIFSPTNITIKMQSPVKINGAVGGDLAFKSYFSGSGNTINPLDDVLGSDPTFNGNSKYLD